MNSYFATVEQQFNPALRGKAIVIGGSAGTRSVIVAASKEAKVYGIHVGMKNMEARQRCPHLLFVDGNPERYSQLTQMFIEIAKQYTDRIDVYSIDEVFLDVTHWCKNIKEACSLAKKIKQDIKAKLGEMITCSIGIAPNRMLAKLASDMLKPDGLTVIEAKDVSNIFQWLELTDLPGLGQGLKRRLYDMGIGTLEKLGKFPVSELQYQFGPVMGQYVSDLGNGIDRSIVPYIDEAAETKSMGHRHTLPRDTVSRSEIYAILLKLAEKVGFRLRRDGYQGRQVWVYLRFSDFSGHGEHLTLKHYLDNGYEVYKIARAILENWSLDQPVRLVGVGVNLLKRQDLQIPLLQTHQREARLIAAQDLINTKFGKYTLARAAVLETKLVRKIGGFKEPNQFVTL